MDAINTYISSFKKYFLENRSLFVIYIALLISYCALHFLISLTSIGVPAVVLNISSFSILIMGLGIIPIAVFQSDYTGEPLSQSVTRPISERHFILSKIAFLFLAGIIPIVLSKILIVIAIGAFDLSIFPFSLESMVDMSSWCSFAILAALLVKGRVQALGLAVFIFILSLFVIIGGIATFRPSGGFFSIWQPSKLVSILWLSQAYAVFTIIGIAWLHRRYRQRALTCAATGVVISTLCLILVVCPPPSIQPKVADPIKTPSEVKYEVKPHWHWRNEDMPSRFSGVRAQFLLEASNVPRGLSADIIDIDAKAIHDNKTFSFGVTEYDIFEFGTSGFELAKTALDVENIVNHSEYSTHYNETVVKWTHSILNRKKVPEELPMQGVATIGLIELEELARFDANTPGQRSRVHWKPVTSCRLLSCRTTPSKEVKARFGITSMLGHSYGLNFQNIHGKFECQYLYALVDKENSQAWLGHAFDSKLDIASWLEQGEIVVTFGVEKVPKNAEIVVLGRKLRHKEKIPFSVVSKKWSEE